MRNPDFPFGSPLLEIITFDKFVVLPFYEYYCRSHSAVGFLGQEIPFELFHSGDKVLLD